MFKSLKILFYIQAILLVYFEFTYILMLIYDNFPHGKLIDWNLNLLTFFPKILEIFTYIIAIFAIICTMNDKVEKMIICDKEYRKILNRLNVNIKDNRSDFETIFKIDIENFKSTHSSQQDYQYHSNLLDMIYNQVIKNYNIEELYNYLKNLPIKNKKYNRDISASLLLQVSKCSMYHDISQFNGYINSKSGYTHSLTDEVKSDKIYKLKKHFIETYVSYLNGNTPYYKYLSSTLYNIEIMVIKNTCKFIDNIINK